VDTYDRDAGGQSSADVGVVLVVGHKRDGRAIYSQEGKRSLVQLCLKRGASVARVAQQHGVNANLLRKWIDAFQGRGQPVGTQAVLASAPKLLPVIEIGSAPELRGSACAKGHFPGSLDRGYIEIEVRGVTIRLHGEVSAGALQTVLGIVVRGS